MRQFLKDALGVIVTVGLFLLLFAMVASLYFLKTFRWSCN